MSLWTNLSTAVLVLNVFGCIYHTPGDKDLSSWFPQTVMFRFCSESYRWPEVTATSQALPATLRAVADSLACGAKNTAVGAVWTHIWQCPRPPHVVLCRSSASRRLQTFCFRLCSFNVPLLSFHCPNSSAAAEKPCLLESWHVLERGRRPC